MPSLWSRKNLLFPLKKCTLSIEYVGVKPSFDLTCSRSLGNKFPYKNVIIYKILSSECSVRKGACCFQQLVWNAFFTQRSSSFLPSVTPTLGAVFNNVNSPRTLFTPSISMANQHGCKRGRDNLLILHIHIRRKNYVWNGGEHYAHLKTFASATA